MTAIQNVWTNIQNYFRDLYDVYLTTMKGLNVTLRVMAEKPFTRQYPEEPTGVTPQYRGFHEFDSNACNGCGICAKRCPVECIAIEKVGKGKDARVTRYAIDYTKCLFCSLCCEACPHTAITMGNKWYLEADSRDDCFVEFEILETLPSSDSEAGSAAVAPGVSGTEKKPSEGESREASTE
jgi:NADH-quinone oxidoreductase subunit I